MREVVFVDYCDEHFAVDVKEEATFTMTLGIDGEWRTIAACDEHGQRWLQVADLLRVHGIKVDAPKRRMGRQGWNPLSNNDPVQCPLCPGRKPSSTRKAFRQHLKQRHDLTVTEFREQHPVEAAAVEEVPLV